MRYFLAVIFFIASVANAEPIRWTLTDALLTDGAGAIGSFVFDSDTSTYSDVDIVVSGGSFLPNTHYDQLYQSFGPFAAKFAADDGSFLNLVPVESLGDAGVISSLEVNLGVGGWIPNDPYTSSQEVGFADTADTVNMFVSGSLTGSVVPLPAAAWLFGSALAGLGWMRRKKSN